MLRSFASVSQSTFRPKAETNPSLSRFRAEITLQPLGNATLRSPSPSYLRRRKSWSRNLTLLCSNPKRLSANNPLNRTRYFNSAEEGLGALGNWPSGACSWHLVCLLFSSEFRSKTSGPQPIIKSHGRSIVLVRCLPQERFCLCGFQTMLRWTFIRKPLESRSPWENTSIEAICIQRRRRRQ